MTLGKPSTFPFADQESKRGLMRAFPALASGTPVRAARVAERGSEAGWLKLGGLLGNAIFPGLSDEGKLMQLLTLKIRWFQWISEAFPAPTKHNIQWLIEPSDPHHPNPIP